MCQWEQYVRPQRRARLALCPSHCEIVGGMAQIFVPCHVIHLHACTGDQRRAFARVPNIVAMTQRDDFADDTQSVSNGASGLLVQLHEMWRAEELPREPQGLDVFAADTTVSVDGHVLFGADPRKRSLFRTLSPLQSDVFGCTRLENPACPLQASHCRLPRYQCFAFWTNLESSDTADNQP